MKKKTTVRSAPDGSDNNHSSERLTRQDLKMAREKDRDGKQGQPKEKQDGPGGKLEDDGSGREKEEGEQIVSEWEKKMAFERTTGRSVNM